jgi:alkylation response protein AidB-like acyl-CoA dehydrogenase
VPERYGGVGLGAVELTALMERMGEHLLCAPFFSTLCLAAQAILLGGSEAQKRAQLPGIAAGRLSAALAYAERDCVQELDALETRFESEPGGGFRISGTKRYVVDGHSADLLVVAARRAGTQGEQGLDLFLVSPTLPGVRRRPLPGMDLTRRLAEISLDGVRVPEQALLGEAPGRGAAVLRETLDRAAIALAAEQVGGAQRCLDLSVDYAKQRVQFGRPIGSFQAIKHLCADMLLLVESARSAAYSAACVAAEGSEGLAVAASLASAYCGDAYFRCAGDAIQIHGGVGFTWEYDPHLHFKRARASQSLLGDPAWHRERVARALGL